MANCDVKLDNLLLVRDPQRRCSWMPLDVATLCDVVLQGVANRDLELDNLLLVRDPQSGNPLLRICDFGYSKVSLLVKLWRGLPRGGPGS